MQQELARTLRRVIEGAALQVLGDVGVDEPDLAAAGIGVGLTNGGLALPQRLDLCAGERDPGLENLADLVVEARLTVVGDDAQLAVRFRRHQSCLPDFGTTIAETMPPWAAVYCVSIPDRRGGAKPASGSSLFDLRAKAASWQRVKSGGRLFRDHALRAA